MGPTYATIATTDALNGPFWIQHYLNPGAEFILQLDDWFLALTCVAVVAVQVAIPYLPPLADAFRASPLDATEWAVVAAIALLPAAVAEVVRRFGRTWVA